MNMLEVSDKVERLMMIVFELQTLIDSMPDAPPGLIDAMRNVKESAKDLDETMPEM